MCLVILLLLAHEEEAHLTIIDHVLYLLLTAGGIERDGAYTHSISAKVCVKVVNTVL